jgi:hypothetical protein
VLASLRLRLWELGRRNRSGSLWRPPFWPDSLAPLFWPALLAVLLIALAAGVAAGGVAIQGGLVKRPPAPETSGAAPSPAAASIEASPAELPAAEPQAVNPQAIAPPAASGSFPPAPPEAVPAPNPLLIALTEPEESGEGVEAALLEAAHSEPARGLLVVRATAAYTALPQAERRERAEAWERRSLELGYERLEVRDGRGRLLARSALVGGGLVLFQPS